MIENFHVITDIKIIKTKKTHITVKPIYRYSSFHSKSKNATLCLDKNFKFILEK